MNGPRHDSAAAEPVVAAQQQQPERTDDDAKGLHVLLYRAYLDV